ncbi:hypothetical protein A374_13700 [Fictibacillus macauensis ZFHKF-1]|uniref:Integral inner membrane protein n=1 Tax=Fictibacillus macauensis ZFHKF-1 TaxID=1196324 RepID=I8UCV3_9BACL|nr:DUF2269 family protein [Fictibacillus macauensis]EIT84750.1 hypothetical protein A374_13700 [Fictibacillus macauensis ZFHKF-1]
MNSAYPLLLYAHIFSVILSIGPFFILLPFIKHLRQGVRAEENAYLSVFKAVVRLSKHAGHVLVVTGILLVYVTGWSWKTPWLLITILILVSSLFFLARAFSPTIRKFANNDAPRPPLASKLQKTIWLYLALMLVMLWLMVAKPMFW